MSYELKVYSADPIKFEQIYGNGNYTGILSFIPYYSLEYDEMKRLEDILKHRKLKITIEVEED